MFLMALMILFGSKELVKYFLKEVYCSFSVLTKLDLFSSAEIKKIKLENRKLTQHLPTSIHLWFDKIFLYFFSSGRNDFVIPILKKTLELFGNYFLTLG